ncbi:hypothetical protein GGU11DRAFT_296874 [Lentinula aff. detonsa]|nr:hypothetical protein GGU11DRAFT_296874 [Lentinula aff. detonsa]
MSLAEHRKCFFRRKKKVQYGSGEIAPDFDHCRIVIYYAYRAILGYGRADFSVAKTQSAMHYLSFHFHPLGSKFSRAIIVYFCPIYVVSTTERRVRSDFNTLGMSVNIQRIVANPITARAKPRANERGSKLYQNTVLTCWYVARCTDSRACNTYILGRHMRIHAEAFYNKYCIINQETVSFILFSRAGLELSMLPALLRRTVPVSSTGRRDIHIYLLKIIN